MHNDPKIQVLIDRYTKEYGGVSLTKGSSGSARGSSSRTAVQNAKSLDVEVLREYLANSKRGVMTLSGYSQLFARPDKQVLQTIEVAPGHGVGIIKDGQLKLHKTVSVKDQYLVSIQVYGLTDIYHQYWEKPGYPKFPDEPSMVDFKDIIKK